MGASRALVAWGCALALGCQLVLPLHQETEPADAAEAPPPADAPAGCDAGVLLTPACASCISTSCCHALGACVANPECAAIISCMQGCPLLGFACDQACITGEHTNGEQDYASLDACLSTSCMTQCQ